MKSHLYPIQGFYYPRHRWGFEYSIFAIANTLACIFMELVNGPLLEQLLTAAPLDKESISGTCGRPRARLIMRTRKASSIATSSRQTS